jgi:hypothetical protein
MQSSRWVKTTGLLIFIFSLPMHAQRAANTLLAVNVGSQCGVSVLSSNQSDISNGSSSQYSGTITFLYYLRTSAGAGSGNIELEVADDSGRAGNSYGSALSYTTELSGAGTSNSGRQTISSSSASFTVASFGADQHSPRQGSTGTINWTLVRDPMSSSNNLPPTLRLNTACR